MENTNVPETTQSQTDTFSLFTDLIEPLAKPIIIRYFYVEKLSFLRTRLKKSLYVHQAGTVFKTSRRREKLEAFRFRNSQYDVFTLTILATKQLRAHVNLYIRPFQLTTSVAGLFITRRN